MKRILSSIFILTFLAGTSHAQQKDLDFYLSAASQHTPSQADLQNQKSINSLDSLQLIAHYGPQVAIGANLLYAPVIKGWGYDPAITNGQNMTGQIIFSKEMTSKANLQTRLAGFSIRQQQLCNQAALSKNTFTQQVTSQYISCYGQQQQYLLALEIDSFLQTEDQILKQLTRSLTIKQTQYLTFKVALQEQHLAVQQQKVQYLNELGTLNYICGIEDSAWTELLEPVIKDSSLQAFEQSIYYQGALLDSIKSENDAQLIALNYKPKIHLFADGGYQSSFNDHAYKNFGGSIGLSLSLPLYDGQQKKYVLLQNKLRQDTRKKYTDFYHRQYTEQILQLSQQLNQYESLLQGAAQQLVYAKILVEANKKQLSTGDVNITDYLLSVNNYLNLRKNIIQNNINRLFIFNQLHHIILQ